MAESHASNIHPQAIHVGGNKQGISPGASEDKDLNRFDTVSDSLIMLRFHRPGTGACRHWVNRYHGQIVNLEMGYIFTFPGKNCFSRNKRDVENPWDQQRMTQLGGKVSRVNQSTRNRASSCPSSIDSATGGISVASSCATSVLSERMRMLVNERTPCVMVARVRVRVGRVTCYILT